MLVQSGILAEEYTLPPGEVSPIKFAELVSRDRRKNVVVPARIRRQDAILALEQVRNERSRLILIRPARSSPEGTVVTSAVAHMRQYPDTCEDLKPNSILRLVLAPMRRSCSIRNWSKTKVFRRDIAVILIAAIALGAMFAYYAISGNEIPVWQALAVGAVNLIAAGRLFMTVKKTRRNQPPHAARGSQNTER